MNNPKHVVVIGGGLAGLSACYDLARAGHRVTVLESSSGFGGLASSLKIEGKPVERFYHFICRSDVHLLEFLDELELDNKLNWKQTRTAFYYNGRLYHFGTPFDLVNFSVVPWMQRIRFGFHIIRSRYRSQWRWLDQIPAKPWLIENIGEEAYNVIWHPLLQIKFGKHYDKISAAWVWNRIWRVATSRRRLWERESFGYLENGSATVIENLVCHLQTQPNVHLITNTKVRSLELQNNKITSIDTGTNQIKCDALLSTVALPVLDCLLPPENNQFLSKLRQIEYIGVVCALFSISKPFSRNFWTNINDPRISFNGIIEQTNLNENLKKAGLNLIYIPYYISTDDPRYKFDDHRLLREYVDMLQLINPAFDRSWIKEWHIFRASYAQAICTTEFADLTPETRSPISGLFITDSTQFYPEDRTISSAIRQGRRAARAIIEELECH